jgi:hypothetical protein
MAEFRPQEILATLDRHGVRYVLIGGLAATARTSRRSPKARGKR